MTTTKTKSQTNGRQPETSEEVLKTIQTDIKFYTENEDGTFALETRTIEEIEDMFGKCLGLN